MQHVGLPVHRYVFVLSSWKSWLCSDTASDYLPGKHMPPAGTCTLTWACPWGVRAVLSSMSWVQPQGRLCF